VGVEKTIITDTYRDRFLGERTVGQNSNQATSVTVLGEIQCMLLEVKTDLEKTSSVGVVGCKMGRTTLRP
jgi:hypothetical protein